MPAINLSGYGLSSSEAAAIQDLVNAIAIPGGAPLSTTYTTVIPLDNANIGRDMGLHVLTAADNFTIAGGALVNATCVVSIQLDASHIPTFAANISVQGDTITTELGRVYELAFVQRPSGPIVVITKTAFVTDTTPPVLGTPHVDTGTANQIFVPITEINGPALNGTTAGVTLGGTDIGGRTCTAVAVTSGVLIITMSSAIVAGNSITLALAAGMVKDNSNNLSASMSTTAVTNNLTGSGSIAITKNTVPVTQNLSLSTHYEVFQASFGVAAAKSGGVFTGPTDFGTGSTGSFISMSGLGTLSWTDSTTGSASGSVTDGSIQVVTTAYGDGVRFVVPATSSTQTIRIWGGCTPVDHRPAINIRATLSDASFAEQTLVIDTSGTDDYSDLPVCFDVAFKSLGSGTMTVQLESVNNSNGGSKTLGLRAIAMT